MDEPERIASVIEAGIERDRSRERVLRKSRIAALLGRQTEREPRAGMVGRGLRRAFERVARGPRLLERPQAETEIEPGRGFSRVRGGGAA